MDFFVLSNLMVRNSKTIENFGTKTHGVAPHINANNWAKIGAFTVKENEYYTFGHFRCKMAFF